MLTGIAFVIMDMLGVQLGFSFSAGLFDYVINFSWPAGPCCCSRWGWSISALYYGLFRFFIRGST